MDAVANVTFVKTMAALGVQYAVVPELAGAVAAATDTPPAE